jgi:2'-5' RNA ligase
MRLFLALHPDKEIVNELEKTIELLKSVKADVKWVNKEALHITLKFLGETDKTRVNGIAPLLSKLAMEIKPFNISSEKLAAFPDMVKPKGLFSVISSGKDEIIAVAKKIDEMLVQAAFKREERPFNPHITLGRVKGASNLPKLSELLLTVNMPKIEQRVKAFYLLKSELIGNRSVYKDLEEFKFAGNG